ncbi:MAG: hypothetical protein QXF12_04485 [Candidatus Aenigmatarchaeota archaeon]
MMSKWFKDGGRDAYFVKFNGNEETAVKFRDSYDNSVIVPIRLVDIIYYYRKNTQSLSDENFPIVNIKRRIKKLHTTF